MAARSLHQNPEDDIYSRKRRRHRRICKLMELNRPWKSTNSVIPSVPHRHSRVGGNLCGRLRRPRHCGLDPQSRGAVSRGGRHTGFKAVSTGQGTPTHTHPRNSSHPHCNPPHPCNKTSHPNITITKTSVTIHLTFQNIMYN